MRERRAAHLTSLLLAAALAAPLLAASLAGAATSHGAPAPTPMVSIPAGEVELLFPVEGEEATPVDAFDIDTTQVTNAQYREFLLEHPEWRRSQVPEVFADSGYLKEWATDTEFGDLDPNAPVTSVSWFAAAAYCEARGARLPTEAEWEMVGMAGQNGPAGNTEPGFNERLLSLTAGRSNRPGPVGAGQPNHYGVQDLHELTWEWVFDIGSSMATGDSRSEGDRRLQLVCGGGSAGATDKNDYAAFLRYAFRSGLSGNYTSGQLGFRCAR